MQSVAKNPTYRYNPDYAFKGVKSQEPFTIRPGPNNPVGLVWVGLNKEGYGIHGTPEPSKVSKSESTGCIRLTNWDALQLASIVGKGVPVEFSGDERDRVSPRADAKDGQAQAAVIAVDPLPELRRSNAIGNASRGARRFGLDRLDMATFRGARRPGVHAARVAIVIFGSVIASHALFDRSAKSHGERSGAGARGEFRHNDKRSMQAAAASWSARVRST